MSAVKKDCELPRPIIAVCPSKPDNLPILAVCPPNPADIHGTFLEPPPIEVQISPTNLDYHEPPPSPSNDLPPKSIAEEPLDETAPKICVCPPVISISSEIQ